MRFWVNENSNIDNVKIVTTNAIFIASCEEINCTKAKEQLDKGVSPLEIFGKDDMTIITLNQIQSITSRSTDEDFDIRYKTKKEIEDFTPTFDSVEQKGEFLDELATYVSSNLVKKESQQSAISAAIMPLISLIIGIAIIYFFMDKMRWPAFIIGGLWALVSTIILVQRMRNPPLITRWIIKGKHFRKTWSGLKLIFSYIVLAVVGVSLHQSMPDTYGEKSLYNAVNNDSTINNERINFFIERGADINYVDEDGLTPLALIMNWYGETEYIVALINAGANLDIDYFEGKSALHYAIYHEYDIDIIEAMLKRGQTLDFKIEGMNPVEYANENLSSEVGALLLKHSSSN